MRLPKKLDGSSPLVAWANNLIDWVQSDRLVSVVGGKLQQTVSGRTLTIDTGGGGAPAAAVGVQRFRLKSIGTNVLVCRTWDGTTEGATDTFVAKPTKLQPRILYEYLDGRLWTYTYPSNTQRVASSTGQPDEQQNIVPRFLGAMSFTGPGPGFPTVVYPGDEIFAAQFEDALFTADGVTPVYYQDLNVDGRAWAKVYGT